LTLLRELCVSVLSALTIIAATFNAEAAEMQSFAEMNCITFGAKPQNVEAAKRTSAPFHARSK
jgi:hypothetical protein